MLSRVHNYDLWILWNWNYALQISMSHGRVQHPLVYHRQMEYQNKDCNFPGPNWMYTEYQLLWTIVMGTYVHVSSWYLNIPVCTVHVHTSMIHGIYMYLYWNYQLSRGRIEYTQANNINYCVQCTCVFVLFSYTYTLQNSPPSSWIRNKQDDCSNFRFGTILQFAV